MDKCQGCKRPNVDDALTPEGLCYECDQGRVDFVVEPECFDGIVEQLAVHNSREPGKKKDQLN